MKFYPAQVVNIIQSSQRDESFIEELQDYLTSALKSFGQANYNRIRKYLPHLTSSWYYLLTSVSNLQTLGEEYTGTIRLNGNNQIPSRYLQLLWLVIYIGGESIFERIINYVEGNVSKSTELRIEAKEQILKLLKFIKLNRDLFLRLHYSLFYINEKYYNVSNRITGIKYVLLRRWMQNDGASSTFKLLGVVSLIYVTYDLIRNYNHQEITHNENFNYSNESTKMCVLCVEKRKNPCATMCGHVFCWDCIYDSLKFQQNCPVCREPISPSRIIFLQNYV